MRPTLAKKDMARTQHVKLDDICSFHKQISICFSWLIVNLLSKFDTFNETTQKFILS